MRFQTVALLSILFAAAGRVSSQAVPPAASEGLDLLVKGRADSAVQLWSRGWTGPEDVGKRQQVLDAFRQLPQMAGRPLGYDLIRMVDVTPHLRRAYFLLRCQRQPVYLLLVLYQAQDEWTVTTINFHTDADHVLPTNLFGLEHPARP